MREEGKSYRCMEVERQDRERESDYIQAIAHISKISSIEIF